MYVDAIFRIAKKVTTFPNWSHLLSTELYSFTKLKLINWRGDCLKKRERKKENVPISVHHPTKATELDVNNSESLVVVVCGISNCHCCLPIQLFACLVYSPGSNRWQLWQKGGVKCWNTVWTNRLRCLRISSFLSSVPIACMQGLLPQLLWLLYFLYFHTIF